MIDLTPLFNAIITILAAIITPRVIAWLRARTDAEKRAELQAWVKIAVAAAEQLYNSSDGERKKKFVLDFLTEQGFNLDLDTLDKTIEAAVLELHNGLRDGGGDGNR